MPRRLTIAAMVLLASAGLASSQTQSTDKIVLSIEAGANTGKTVELSVADLEKMGTTQIKTTTPWHEGIQVFEGVPLSRLMHHAAASGSRVQVIALNKYRTELPFSDFEKYRPILALKRNGQYMEVKDKGPLFIIYPFDEKPELKTEQFFGKSAWQVRTLTVE